MKSKQELDSIFLALANEKRRSMVHYLSLQPLTVKGLAVVHSLSLPAMHKHIKLLEGAKLIIRKKVGRVNFIALNKGSLRLAQDWLMQYRAHWGDDKQSLENYIEQLSK